MFMGMQLICGGLMLLIVPWARRHGRWTFKRGVDRARYLS